MRIGSLVITTTTAISQSSKDAADITAFAGTLARIESKIDQLLKGQTQIMADLTKLQADVAANADVEKSAVALLQGLKAQLDAAGTDPVALAALSSSLESQTSDLAAAVAANTPAAQPVP